MLEPAFHRILLKLSGEIFAGKNGYGIDPKITNSLAKKIIQISEKNIQIGIVIGCGNIYSLKCALEKIGCKVTLIKNDKEEHAGNGK